jgi:hypothetical protein
LADAVEKVGGESPWGQNLKTLALRLIRPPPLAAST